MEHIRRCRRCNELFSTPCKNGRLCDKCILPPGGDRRSKSFKKSKEVKQMRMNRNKDGTGPSGQGPKTGRGKGNC